MVSLSGFTIVRNAVKYDYPVVESIRSLLPLVDEMIVAIGESEDETVKIIKAIKSSKIKLYYRRWNDEVRENGLTLSNETNFALKQISGEWGFYLQADEVLHEKDYPLIRESLMEAERLRKKAIVFKYLHFKGDYWSINPWAYQREIRLIKNHSGLQSIGDACTFKTSDNENIATYKSRAKIYHYGWVKPPKTMVAKAKNLDYFYHNDDYIQSKFNQVNFKNIYDDVKVLREFTGEHPAVMHQKVNSFRKITRRKKRWLYWDFYKKFFKYGRV